MKSIDFVYFDVGGVLISNDIARERLAKRLQRPKVDVTAFFDSHWETVCRGEVSDELYLQELVKHFGIITEESLFSKFYAAFVEPIREMHAVVYDVMKYFSVGIISNAESGSIEALIDRSIVPNVPWKTTVISAYHKSVKPEQKIFEIAQREANVPHESIFLIDDRPDNINAAKKLGWKSFLFDPSKTDRSVKRLRNLFTL